MPESAVALLLALPWIALPLLAAAFVRRRPALDDWAPSADGSVTAIVPARDEERSLGACLASILASGHPRLDVVVVDDGSRDGTAEVAEGFARRGEAVRVVRSAPLPNGWVGKTWACAQGAEAARGDVLAFVDADVRLHPQALGRAAAGMGATGADLLSVLPRHHLEGAWERLVTPHFGALFLMRYPDPSRLNRSAREEDRLALGGLLLARRAAYERVGGHGAVRAEVGEDVALGRVFGRAAMRTALACGERFASVRMHASLREIVYGWSRCFAPSSAEAGRRAGEAATAWAAAAGLVYLWMSPWVALALWALGVPGLVPHAWAAVAVGLSLPLWAWGYRRAGLSPAWALAYPAGAMLAACILARAALAGGRVEWKGRVYPVAEAGR